jgi:uncharacterized protein Veg
MKNFVELKLKSDLAEKSKKKLKRIVTYMETLVTHFIQKVNTAPKNLKRKRSYQFSSDN